MQYPHCTSLTLPGAASQEATFPHPPPVGVHPMAPLLVLTGGIPCFFVNSSQLFTRTHTRFAGMKLYPDSDRKSAMERVSATVVAHGAPETRATVRPAGSMTFVALLPLLLLSLFPHCAYVCMCVCAHEHKSTVHLWGRRWRPMVSTTSSQTKRCTQVRCSVVACPCSSSMTVCLVSGS